MVLVISIQDSPQEAYIDLGTAKAVQLPHSLSHIDMDKFLENEPVDGALASSTPVDGLEQSTETITNNQSRRKKSKKVRKRDDLQFVE